MGTENQLSIVYSFCTSFHKPYCINWDQTQQNCTDQQTQEVWGDCFSSDDFSPGIACNGRSSIPGYVCITV